MIELARDLAGGVPTGRVATGWFATVRAAATTARLAGVG